ncbi:MAG: tetratricopeptide repeat protein [Acidobacteriota bacterium]|nr:tetratricopeptide repeat protein [Acidobacteriota bacterium]
MSARSFAVIAMLLVLHGLSFGQNAHLQKALELFQKEHYTEALQEFESARAAQPGNAAIENALGITETKLGRIEAANRHYLESIRLNSGFEEAHKNLAFNYLSSNQFGPAEKELNTALHLQPDDPYPHFYLVMLYLATSRDQQAVEQVKPSLPLLVNDRDTAFQLGKACFRMNRTDQAASIVNRLDSGDGFTLDERRELANLFFEKHSYLEAAEQFRRIVSADANSWENKFNLAVALLNAKKADEAIKILGPLAAERPNDAKTVSLLGSAYEGANKMPEALEAYKREAYANPQESDGYLDYTRLLMDLARYDEAQQFVAAGLKVVREPYPLYMRLGSVQMMASKYDQARESFQRAVDEHPEISVGYVALAQICFKTGQNEQAAKLLADARQKLKPDFLLEYYYGLSLDRLGKQGDAVTAFEKAVALNPDVAEIHFELGKLYFGTNRIDEARAQLEKSIQINPHYAKSYVYLSRIYARLGDSEKAHRLADQARQFKQDEREESVRSQESRLRSFQPLQSE